MQTLLQISNYTQTFSLKIVTNSGRAWDRWKCLFFNVNIEGYAIKCSDIFFDIAGIRMSMPPDIREYYIIEMIRDSNAYNHMIYSMLLTMSSFISAQQVLDKHSELLQHKNAKNTFQKTIKTEENEGLELLTNSSSHP
ncbi:hypothetical protein O181_102305 [Austropuccinia psidii MF-1]|uniref:Uncharacterized protein n=1 Tax=Austropuccinia psidii MF-1 TaxID=1389203 RepID=A0A9Q3JG09_9BASI|nr:hypothetical protein [Austropuccinia psidii MF-1]